MERGFAAPIKAPTWSPSRGNGRNFPALAVGSRRAHRFNLAYPVCCQRPGGPEDGSPRRQPWDAWSGPGSPGRGDRHSARRHRYACPLPPLPGLSIPFLTPPTALAVGYGRSHLRRCGSRLVIKPDRHRCDLIQAVAAISRPRMRPARNLSGANERSAGPRS